MPVDGARDGVNPDQKSEVHHRFFTAYSEWRLLENVGRNLQPAQDAPNAFAQAMDLCKRQ
jgi:hypothetical protein